MVNFKSSQGGQFSIVIDTAGLWACVDARLLGLIGLALALAILIWFTSIAVRTRLWRRVVVYLAYAAAFLLGHFLLAPLMA